MPAWLNKPLLGVPTWGWLVGLGVTAIAVVYFLRKNATGGTASSSNATGTPAPNTVAVPYPVYSTPSPTNNNQPSNILVPSNLAQWVWSGTGWFPNPKNLPPGWAWGQSGAYALGGGPAQNRFIWTSGGWMPNPSNPPPDWVPELLPSASQMGSVSPGGIAMAASDGFPNGASSTPITTQSSTFGNVVGVAQQPGYVQQ